MLPDSPCPRAALALSDLQPQTGASTFAVGTGSGNWSTHGVGGIGGDAYLDKSQNNNGGGLFGGMRNQDRSLENPLQPHNFGPSSHQGGLFGKLPECNEIPKVLCCSERVIDKCLSGCLDHVTENCPEKLEKFETIGNELPKYEKTPQRSHSKSSSSMKQSTSFGTSSRRRTQQSGDYKLLNNEYPLTEVSDKDLTSDCGTKRSLPPFSPCLSRKTVDDLFLSCCQQHVPANCHSLCTYEHREHVAAENLIQAVQQDGCDLKFLSNILYCANQNRDNRECCTHLGMSNEELGVGDRCLRMCNIAQSGDRLRAVEKDDLVCLSNWNVIMYCARGGLRTIN
ncbi:unnamed protein product, partial [Mesorhabditis belari]|uniref:Domain of unknown function DB domain-containing protein n=1 Tax=Mesorhabditis belari TaxID=2138241 RepID=A0AAF3F802_9BILA